MRYKTVVAFCISVGMSTPSHAVIGEVLQAAKQARDQYYQEFMMLKAVQTLKAMVDNYKTSVRYYNQVQEMAKGGLLQNIRSLKGMSRQQYEALQEQMKEDWINNPGHASNLEQWVDNTVKKMEGYAGKKTKFAEESIKRTREKEIALESISDTVFDSKDGTVSQKDLAKLQILQIQTSLDNNLLMSQMLDVNAHTVHGDMMRQAQLLKTLKENKQIQQRNKFEANAR